MADTNTTVEQQTSKIYEVMFLDEFDNINFIGFFKNLDDAIPGVNKYITNDAVKQKLGDLVEYKSFFGNQSIDKKIILNGAYFGEIKGFVWTLDEFKAELGKIK